MTWQTQRGIAQLIIGLCCLCFALSMCVRSYRDGGIGWPLRWRMLVALWIGNLGALYLLHAYFWMVQEEGNLGRRLLIWPLWLLAGTTLWTLARWVRDDPMGPHE